MKAFQSDDSSRLKGAVTFAEKAYAVLPDMLKKCSLYIKLQEPSGTAGRP